MERLRRLPGTCPVTWAVVGANALTFVITFVTRTALWSPLVFHPATASAAPWSVVTYPLVSTEILWVLLGGYMLWLFGGSLERGWGARDYLVFLVLTSAASALGLWVGSAVTRIGVALAGLPIPLASAVVAWSVINPRERLLLYFLLPIEARWLGVASAILVFFSFHFPLGLFALAGPGAAWWYVRRGRYAMVRPSRPRSARLRPLREGSGRTLNPFALYRRWRLKRQFMRLMRGPGGGDAGRGPH
ncbi:MAG: rhomboid family intramembrane serine protease [Armatimonadota bacterium]|nr:rhomboid family intramembrane serine protease [Armatimonadota bacterium]MDR7450795.1 rhomboid family intramembrane serine protease [Armatimonadota bacterium]MDR7466151.1 rhomboid family intramembrane serine protease [Armatimonadota bacterium]MDR7493812.1 rhomboid family intramembrane serine protease [Armatimonadota bacterium]MDR7499027.1 rhomboid family intramembrane serine protease [Armatimonadota bacterium]